MPFDITRLELEGAFLIDSFYQGDKRGGFAKYFEKDAFVNSGIEFQLNETFVSVSRKNVIRGLHFQLHHPQAKLVTVVRGKLWDVIVDLRLNSLTYKKWIGVELSDENHKVLFVPRGFAHGFLALEDETMMLYQCDGKYDKETDTGIIYNDPELSITWPVDDTISIHSDRDLQLMSLAEYERSPIQL